MTKKKTNDENCGTCRYYKHTQAGEWVCINNESYAAGESVTSDYHCNEWDAKG